MTSTTTTTQPTAAAAPAAANRKELRFGGVHGSKATPYLFLLPYLLLFLTFVVVPAIFGIWISLHSWDFLLPGKPFVGLDNYTALADPDSVQFLPFWQGMRATAIFTVASVPTAMNAGVSTTPCGVSRRPTRPRVEPSAGGGTVTVNEIGDVRGADSFAIATVTGRRSARAR